MHPTHLLCLFRCSFHHQCHSHEPKQQRQQKFSFLSSIRISHTEIFLSHTSCLILVDSSAVFHSVTRLQSHQAVFNKVKTLYWTYCYSTFQVKLSPHLIFGFIFWTMTMIIVMLNVDAFMNSCHFWFVSLELRHRHHHRQIVQDGLEHSFRMTKRSRGNAEAGHEL